MNQPAPASGEERAGQENGQLLAAEGPPGPPGGAPPTSASSGWALMLSLVALIIALAVAAHSFWQARQPPVALPIEGVPQPDHSAMDALAARIDNLAGGKRRQDDELARLGREVTALRQLPDQIEALQAQVRRYAGGDRNRSAWLMAEAEHYLRIANIQLGLASDVPVSQTALGLADDALRELDDPRLTPVRRLLSAEMAALDRVPRPDLEGIVLTLGSLAESLPDLTLRQPVPERFHGTPAEAAGHEAWDRALAALRGAFATLIQVRRTDEPVTPLLDEAGESLLLRSLEIELQLARLAVMRGDAGMYRRSLEAAIRRLERDFDPAAPDTGSTIATLRELGEIRLPEALPDISGSLALLTELMRTGEAARQ